MEEHDVMCLTQKSENEAIPHATKTLTFWFIELFGKYITKCKHFQTRLAFNGGMEV